MPDARYTSHVVEYVVLSELTADYRSTCGRAVHICAFSLLYIGKFITINIIIIMNELSIQTCLGAEADAVGCAVEKWR